MNININKLITYLIAIITFLFLQSCSEPEQKELLPKPVFAMEIGSYDALAKRSFPGRAKASQEVNQSFRVAGPLIEFPVKVGDEVKAGDLVARMDPTDYITALRNLEGQLAREQARSKRAQADLVRLQNIYKEDPGATSETAIDRATQIRDSAAASVRSIAASVDNARNQLSYTELKAPFDGVVVETYVDNFETVRPKQPILRILNPSSIEFIIYVPESLIGYAPYVTAINVQFDALSAVKIPAVVKEISKEATRATRTYPVTLVMAQPEGIEILPGMAGTAAVESKLPEEDVFVGIEIPATAVFSGKDLSKSYVWVIDQDTMKINQREVQLGALAQRGTQISQGLKDGDWIVTKGVNSLKQDQLVKIINEDNQDAS